MIIEAIPDLPRLHTAIAEWMSCLIYILILGKRIRKRYIALTSLLFLSAFIIVHQIGEAAPLALWIPWMMAGMALMFLFIIICSDVSVWDAGYIWARAFIAAELAASLHWQVYFHTILQNNNGSQTLSFIFMGTIYLLVFLIIGGIESRQIPKNTKPGVSFQDFTSAFLIAISAFAISNMTFAFKDTAFTGSIGAGILTVRTLVDFSGFTILFAQQKQRREVHLKYELDAINSILVRQNINYQQTKESIELIQKQHHDLKHQIEVIRKTSDPHKRESYLAEIDEAIAVYEAQNKTGNVVLDTLLTGKKLQCLEKKVNITCIADGELLDFINVMDICSIFGNALDNAIESVEKLEMQDKRLIRVAVFSQNRFLMIRIENYIENEPSFEEGLPKTTKDNKMMHGFGIKSIKSSIEKYGGNLTINIEDSWFILRLIIPLPEQ